MSERFIPIHRFGTTVRSPHVALQPPGDESVYLATGRRDPVAILYDADAMFGMLTVEDVRTILRYWREHGVEVRP